MSQFHVVYGDYEAVYDFEGNRIAGKLPRKQNRLVEAWCELHVDELNAARRTWYKVKT
ncbi:MAG: DUF4160 domain-containing protein [Oscillospiraceae bacterium]|nr:DUF4160 domain-containing protein [Oscillospiraceae bacterium]